MTHVITQQCCNDAACVPVCPVNCIHPTPDEPDYGSAEMLYIDPQGCIDCGACLSVCPVNAIEPDYDLPPESLPFLELNAAYFEAPGRRDYDAVPPDEPAPRAWPRGDHGTLRVAVVGGGPAAGYAVQHLLAQRGLDVEIDVFERLLTPSGLIRFGVAPDHQSTKRAGESMGRALRSTKVRVFLGADVGADIGIGDLTRRYHAVILGVGAPQARRLGIDGEGLPGSHAATDVVGWYNGHPDQVDANIEVQGERAVIIGNGNVALDVARLLALEPSTRERTDMADHALDRLATHRFREIRVVGRRGADVAAFTVAELIGLRQALGPRLTRSEIIGPLSSRTSAMESYKRALVEELPTEAPPGDAPVVVLDFCRTPVSLVGQARLEAVLWARTTIDAETGLSTAGEELEELPCDFLVSAIGTGAIVLEELPFDHERGVFPHREGRVVEPDSGAPLAGVYVTGWAKRGPQGAIGTNRHCAWETTEALLDDWEAGRLPDPQVLDEISDLLPDVFPIGGWTALDAHERAAGRQAGRPRVKLVDPEAQRAVMTAASPPPAPVGTRRT